MALIVCYRGNRGMYSNGTVSEIISINQSFIIIFFIYVSDKKTFSTFIKLSKYSRG